jgi:hypothetical protein
MVSFLSNQWQCAIALTVVVLIMLVGLLPSANPVLAQENTVTGEWEFDVEIQRALQSDGSTVQKNLHITIVARLSEVESGFTGNYIDASGYACKVAEISGSIQGDQVTWTVHYTGSCCLDAEMLFQGTLSQDKNTMTGTLSPVRPPSPGCELWWANVTGKKVIIPKPAPTPTPPSSISGHVTDSNKKPIVGVTISDGAGHTVKTGKEGNYRLGELAAGTYTLTPSKKDYTFSPASQKVKVLPDATEVNFGGTATACENALFAIPHAGTMGWPYMDPGKDVIIIDGTIHRGIDIPGNDYDPVYAPYDGKVIVAGDAFRIRHPALRIDTYYGHVTNTLSVSTQVKRGQKVAELLPLRTRDGKINTHLHFTITKLDASRGDKSWATELIFANSIDPSPYFNAQLNYFDGTLRFQRPVLDWCNKAATGTIEGRVMLPNGEVVSNAEVRIEGTQQYRWTDYWTGRKEGRYKFSNAPVGEVKITAILKTDKGDLKGSEPLLFKLTAPKKLQSLSCGNKLLTSSQ